MTDKKKQIEELARHCCLPCEKEYCGRCIEGFDPGRCTAALDTAEAIYNAGYRKQRYGENLTENHPVDEFICSECGLITRENTRIEIDEDADGDEAECEFEIKFCPRCGVKVKGGESDA